MPESVVVGSDPLRVVLADDHEPARILLRVLLGLVDGVEVVGEAKDGREVLGLAQEKQPHLVILDLNMPQLDGVAAAEALRASNPEIQVVLYTANPHSERLADAARLGIHVNDKADPESLVERLEAAASRAAELPSAAHRLQAALLTAFVGGVPGQALVVATPDGGIPAYNQEAADFLHWPYPPRPMLLAEARERLPAFDLTGKRLSPQERPISRALATRRPVPEEPMVVLRDGVFVPIVTGATPLFDDDGEFLGAANYFRPTDDDLTGFRPQMDDLRRPSEPD